MSNIDVAKNVVQMVFDNVGFERNAAQSLETIQKLKDALNFDGAVRGLENLSQSVKGFGMDSLSNGVYKVQEGFSALDVVATRVLQNITDKVQNVAMDLAQKVTIEPLKAGLEEYETQINSVQTILANTNDALMEQGLTTEHDRIEKVNGVLDELNHYADMTIYNFTEMTRNIGTFTAAGVELDTAATSIQGIANLAAMSGSNSQQASTAMYQLSQAIAAGSVKLQDWNSVVNAGMGGKLFQNELIDTAKAMGVADEQFVALTQGATTFRESLSSGWISAEVLTNTLEKFTAGSEGYTKSQVQQMQQLWRARGYSEQQIQELTGSIHQLTEKEEENLRTKWAEKGFSDEQIDHILSMGTAATEAATKVKTFSQLLETVGEALQSGWTQSWEYIIGDFEQAKMLWTEVSDIMNLYIGKSADARNNVLKEWSRAAYSYNENGELIKLTYDEAGNLIKDADEQVVEGGKMLREEMGGRELVIQSLRNTFQGMFEVAMEFGKAWDLGFWGKGTQNDISITAQKLKDMSLSLYDFTNNFKNAFQRDETGKAIGLLGDLRTQFELFAESIRAGFDGVRNVFSGLGNIFNSFFKSSFFNIDTLGALISSFSEITYSIKAFGDAFKKHFGNDSLGKNQEGLIKFFSGLKEVLQQLLDVKMMTFDFALQSLGKIFESLIPPGETVATIMGKVGDKMATLGGALRKFFWDEDVSKIETLFTGISDSFIGFIGIMKDAGVDFKGISFFFNQLISLLNGDRGDKFNIITDFFTGLTNIFQTLLGVMGPIIDAFTEVFGRELSSGVYYLGEFVSRFKEFTESIKPSKEVMEGIHNLFTGIFEVVTALGHVIATVLLSAWDSLKEILSSILPTGTELSTTFTDIGTKLTEFANKIRELVDGGDGVPKLSELMGSVTDKFIKFMDTFKNLNLLEAFVGLIKQIGDGLKHALGGTDDMSLLDTILEKIKGFLQGLKDVLSDENGQLDMVKVFEAGGIGVVIKKLIDFFKEIKDGTANFRGFLGVFQQIGDAFESLSETLGENFKANSIKAIATSLLEIAGALFIIAMIDPMRLTMAIAALAGVFDLIDTLLMSLKAFTKTDAAALGAAAAVIQTLGNSVLMLAGAIALLGNMDLLDLAKGLGAVALMMQMMVKVVQELTSIQGEMPKVVGTLIGLAVALNLLVIPIELLGRMDLFDLAKGLGAVALMMYGMVTAVGTLAKTTKESDLIGTGFAIIEMAVGINLLASAVTKVADLSWEQIGKGLAVMAAGLVAMVGAAKVVDEANLSDELVAIGGSLIMLGVAMVLMSTAAQGIANVSWEDLGKMAAVLAGALIALGVASALINGANLFLIGSAILMVAEAIALLTATLLAAEVIGPIAMSLGAAVNGIKDSLVNFANNAAMSAFLDFLKNLILLIPELAVGLAQGIIKMVATLGEGAGELIGAVVKIGSAIISGLMELLPKIFDLVRQTIEQVVQLVIDETPRIFEGLRTFFQQLWPFIMEQIPGLFGVLTTWTTELLTFLQNEGPRLVETLRLILDTVLQAIIAEAPRITETILTILQSVLTVIQTAVPQIIETLLSLLAGLLAQLAEYIPQMANSAMQIILGFLTAIAEHIQDVVEAAASIAVGFMLGLAEKMPEIVDAAFKLIIGFIDGLASAIEENHNALFEAIGHLIKAIVEAIIDGVTMVAQGAADLISGFLAEFDLGKFASDLFNAGANLVKGIIDGIVGWAQNLWNEAGKLAQGALDMITGVFEEHSPSQAGYRAGAYLAEGVELGIEEEADSAISAAGAMAYGVLGEIDKMNSANVSVSPKISPVFNDDELGTDEFTPVMDSNVTKKYETWIGGTYGNHGYTVELDHEVYQPLSDMMDIGNYAADKLSRIDDRLNLINQGLSDSFLRILTAIDSQTNFYLEYQDKGQNIYMDTGSLVGAIAPQMDEALGMSAILSQRGV